MHHTSSKPVICQLVHGLPVGGTEVLVDRLIRRLADRFHFVVACLDEAGELGQQLVDDGFEVNQLGRRPGFDWGCVRRLGRRLESQGVQLVHAHQYTPFAYAAAMRALGRRPRIVFTEHGRFYPDVASRKRKLFNRVMTSRHDRFIAVGGSVRQALIDKEGLPGPQIEVVYNGVSQSPLRPTPAQRADVRAELGVAESEFLVLQVARLDTIKDHATALRTIAAAVRQDPRLKLHIIGDGPERPSIERQVAELGLAHSVKILGQRRDVPRLLAAADAFLLTSVSEGIPVTIIEAMAARLPVISTAVGGVPEMIENGVSGMLASAGDDAGLASALVRLANDAQFRNGLIDCGAHRAAQCFSEDLMIERYAHIYSEMLEARIGIDSRQAPNAAPCV